MLIYVKMSSASIPDDANKINQSLFRSWEIRTEGRVP